MSIIQSRAKNIYSQQDQILEDLPAKLTLGTQQATLCAYLAYRGLVARSENPDTASIVLCPGVVGIDIYIIYHTTYKLLQHRH